MNRRMYGVLGAAWGVAMLMAGPALAAEAVRPASKAKTEAMIVAEITEQLASKDAAQHKLAVEAIRARLRLRGLYELRSTWLKPMMANQQYQEVADLALEGILASPWETRSVEQVLQMRIKALLALGKTQQALSEAKGLFNVASMAGTSEAILVMAECLNAMHPTDPTRFNTFRQEQMDGANWPAAAATTRPSTPPGAPNATASGPAAIAAQAGLKCTVLQQIQANAALYEETLKKLTGEDAQLLMGRGNLLLLCDRVKEAKVIFERLYSLSGSDVTEASEALARIMKAEDGTVGRANAWVLAIRPKKPQ